jgi:hypothetical protein
MKAYLSFWKGGWQQYFTNFKSINETVINLHKISAFLAKKHFKEVHFLTDNASKDFFKDIPFDSVECIYDNLDFKYNPVWAISKMIAYKHICQKGDPFIHIDYDVFLWGNLPERLLKADVFGQNEEYDAYYGYQVENFLKHFSNTNLIGKIKPKPRHAINTGIFGGNNLDFIQKYSQSAIDIVFDKQNEKSFLSGNIFIDNWNKSTIIEQYNLTVACEYYNIKPELLFENGWPSEEEAKAKGFTHLMSAKNNQNTKEKIKLITTKLK